MVSDFSLFFLKRVQLILSKAFSLYVIYPVRTNSNVMWLPFGKRIAFSGHRLKGWPRAACSVRGRSEKMPAQCAQMCHKSVLPDFNSPVLTGKQKLRQPQPRTHIYTEKTRQCWETFNLHSWTTPVSVIRAPSPPRSLSQVPELLPHDSTVCNTDATENPRPPRRRPREMLTFLQTKGTVCFIPMGRFFLKQTVSELTKAHSGILHLGN